MRKLLAQHLQNKQTLQAIVAEASARADADSDESAARIAGDATVQAAVDAEQSARIAADLAEAQTRAAAVSDLQSQLNSVTGTDLSALQSQLDAIVGTSPETLDTIQEVVAAFEGADSDLTGLIIGNSSTITAVNASLTQEVSDRTFFDAAEKQQREDADSDLQSAIDSLSATVSSNNAAKTSAISTETAARVAGDEAEAEAREAAITAEATARVAGDATVQAAVDAEAARATSAEQANASAISAETARATAAETDLQNQINQVEATGATHPLFSTLADLPDASANHGMFAHVHAEGAAYFAHAGQWVELAKSSDLANLDLSSIQSQIDAILGSSPESLDTLQEIVAAFESADGDLQALMVANSSDISSLESYLGHEVSTVVGQNLVTAETPAEMAVAKSGSVSVYTGDILYSGNITHTITSPSGSQGSFGASVAKTGNHLWVSAPDAIPAAGTGRVYHYDLSTNPGPEDYTYVLESSGTIQKFGYNLVSNDTHVFVSFEKGFKVYDLAGNEVYSNTNLIYNGLPNIGSTEVYLKMNEDGTKIAIGYTWSYEEGRISIWDVTDGANPSSVHMISPTSQYNNQDTFIGNGNVWGFDIRGDYILWSQRKDGYNNYERVNLKNYVTGQTFELHTTIPSNDLNTYWRGYGFDVDMTDNKLYVTTHVSGYAYLHEWTWDANGVSYLGRSISTTKKQFVDVDNGKVYLQNDDNGTVKIYNESTTGLTPTSGAITRTYAVSAGHNSLVASQEVPAVYEDVIDVSTVLTNLDTTAQTIGAAINELHAEMADNSATSTAVQAETDARVAAISAEETSRIAGDATNASAIVDESNARAAADTAETQARISADNALDAKIVAETAARESSQTSQATLISAQSTALNTEISNRTTADSGLQTQIDDIVAENAARTASGATVDEVNAVQSNLDAEVVRAQLAEQANASAIVTGDAALQAQLDAIIGTSPETLDTLQEIVTAYSNADSTLQGLINTNTGTLAALQTTIGAEGVPLITPDIGETITFDVEYAGRQFYATADNHNVYVYDSVDSSTPVAKVYFSGYYIYHIDANSEALFINWNVNRHLVYRYEWADLVLGITSASKSYATAENQNINGFAVSEDYIYAHETSGTDTIWKQPLSESGSNLRTSTYNIASIVDYKLRVFGDKLCAFRYSGVDALWVLDIRQSDGHLINGHELTSGDQNSDVISWANGELTGSFEVSSTRIAVGAYGDDIDGPNHGSVYLFNPDNLNEAHTKLYPPAEYATNNLQFGYSIALTDTRLIVGTLEGNTPGITSSVGLIFIYDANNLLLPPLVITPPENNLGIFPYQMHEESNRLIVAGSSGTAMFVYDLTNMDQPPERLVRGDSSTASGNFGRLIAISPAETVTQTITDTIIPASGLGNSINYLEAKRQELRADLEANLAAIQSNDADIASIAADVATNTANIATNAAAIVAVDADRTAFEASVNADRQAHRDAVQADIDQVNADRTAFEASVNAERQGFEDAVNASQAQFIVDHDSDYNYFTSSVSGSFADTNLLQNEIRGRMGTGHIALPQELTSITYNKDVGDQYYTVIEGDDEFFVYTSAEYVENQSVQTGLGTRVVLPSAYNSKPEGNFITRDHVIVMARLDNTSLDAREIYFLVYELATIDSSSLPIAEVHADLRTVYDYAQIRYDGGSKVLIGNVSTDTVVGSARIYDVPSLVSGNAIYIETTSEDLPTGVNYPTLGSNDYDGFACRVDWNDTHVFVGALTGQDRIFVYNRTDLSYVTTLQDSIYDGGVVASNFVVSNTMIAAVQNYGSYYVHDNYGRLMVWDASNLNAAPFYRTDNSMMYSSVYRRYSNAYYLYNSDRKLAVSDDWLVFGSTEEVVMVTKDDLFNNNFPSSGNNYSWIPGSFGWIEAQFKGGELSGYNFSNVRVYQFAPNAWGGISNIDGWDYPSSIQIQNDKLIITSRNMKMSGGTSEDTGTIYIHDLNNFTDLVNGVEGVSLQHPVMIEETGFGYGNKLPAVSATGTVTLSVTETFNPNDDLTAAVNYLNAKKEELLTAVEAVTGSSTIVQDLQTVEANIDFKLLAQDQRYDSDKAEQIALYDSANAEQTAIYAAANAEQSSIYDSANAAHVAYFEQYTSGETLSRQNADNNLQTQITSNDGDIASLQSQIDTIVGTSPETLDTLQELVSAYENADHDLQTLISGNDSDIQSIKDIISQTKAPKYYQTEHGMVSFGGGSSTVSASGYSTTSLYFTNSQSYATIPNTVANNINGYPVYALEILNGENVMYRIESPTRITLGSGGAQFSSGYWNTMTVPLHTNTGAQQIINHTGTWGSDYNIIPSNTISPAPGGRAYDEHLTGNNYSFDAIRFYGSNGSLLTEYDLRSTRTGSAVLENGQVVSSDYNELDTTVGTTAKTIYGAINELHSEIGNSTLSTSSQTLSGAINELKSDLDPLSNPALETAATDVVGAINELNTSLQSITGSDTQFLDDIATNQTDIAGHDSDFVDVRGRLDVIEDTSVPNLQAQIDVHSGQIATEVADRAAGDAALQSQIDNIVGTSPETLDTLQEVVSTFQNADNDLQALITGNTSIVSTHTTQIATLDDQIHAGAGLTVPNMPTEVSRWVYQDQYIVTVSASTADVPCGHALVFDANSPLSPPTVLSPEGHGSHIGATSNMGNPRTAKIIRDKVVVGYDYSDPGNVTNAGEVYVWDLNDLSADPVVLKPSNTSAYNYFGWSVTGSADHNYIIVGEWGRDWTGRDAYNVTFQDNSGRVYLYDINNLTSQPIILDPTGIPSFWRSNSSYSNDNLQFGRQVEVDEDYLYVTVNGYSYYGSNNYNSFIAIFDLRDIQATPSVIMPPNGQWSDDQDGSNFGHFSNGTAFNDNYVAVGSRYGPRNDNNGVVYGRGAVYVYPKNTDGYASGTMAYALQSPDSQDWDNFGRSVALDDTRLYVGSYGWDGAQGSDVGKVEVFDVSDGSHIQTIYAYDGNASDYFGYSLDVEGGKLVVSSHGDDDNSTTSGSLYIYDTSALSGIPIKVSESFVSMDTSNLGSYDLDLTIASGAVEIKEVIIPNASLSDGINYLEGKTEELKVQVQNVNNSGALTAMSNSNRLDVVETLTSNLEDADSAEQAARVAGDASLQTQIDNLTIAASGDVSVESAARIAGDSDEAAARIAGDATVQSCS
jgi:hypothetical protein